MKRRLVALTGWLLAAAALAAPPPKARAQVAATPTGDEIVLQARDALRLRDGARLATLRQAAQAEDHPLASWVDYWELSNRLGEAQPSDFEAFAERWRGSYVEDRGRNDWLLELGRRRDWANLRLEFPRFRMNDDREVTCYALLAQHHEGQEVRQAARSAWLAQRESDDGCQLLAQTLLEARQFGSDELWAALRLATEGNRARLARERAAQFDARIGAAVEALFKDPARVLRERREVRGETSDRLAVLALWRAAAADPDLAFTHLEQHYAARLSGTDLALAWAGVARQAALKQHPRAAEWARRAWSTWDRAAPAQPAPFGDETLAWMVRAALRAPPGFKTRWADVQRGIDAMSATEQRDPAWAYWRARALRGQAPAGPDGEGARALARMTLEGLAGSQGFYAQLAQEDLGRKVALPAPAPALNEAERELPQARPGLQRALKLIALGLRGEGVREWNYMLRGLGDRELLAAAQLACDREIWDRCINTSERTRQEADFAQRYPTPHREALLARAKEADLDPALVFGLIRQESRFLLEARSHVGAAGLMQLMPSTARWTARKVGLDWKPELVTDRDINLHLGATYLKLVLDDFGGQQPMAAAAYNAGPSRPRRWREGPPVEAAAWVEAIPFNETRDYVKKVLANAVIYSARLGLGPSSLKARLGGPIGPRDPGAPVENRELP